MGTQWWTVLEWSCGWEEWPLDFIGIVEVALVGAWDCILVCRVPWLNWATERLINKALRDAMPADYANG